MKASSLILMLAAGAVLAGCHTDMWVQPKSVAYRENDMFPDGKSARPLEEGVVARGHLRTDVGAFTGRGPDGKFVAALPATLKIWGKTVSTTKQLKVVLDHGEDRFNAFCSHCHGKTGNGDGMITQRGLILRRKPATYHTDRLRKMPIGYFFHVMTDGMGTMFSQAERLNADDRWAIAAYIRVLQASQNVDPASLSAEQKAQIDQKTEEHESSEGTTEEAGH